MFHAVGGQITVHSSCSEGEDAVQGKRQASKHPRAPSPNPQPAGDPLEATSSVSNAFSYFCYTTACPEGEAHFLYDGCAPCSAGSFSDSTSTSPCTPCPEGTYSSATGAIECTGTCPPEAPWSSEGTTVPRNCAEPSCAANTYWAGPDEQCASCPPHLKFSRAGSMSIAGCFSIRASLFASSYVSPSPPHQPSATPPPL